MTTQKTLTEILAEGHQLPDGYDTWGWKVVRPDLRTRDGFRWPWPGNTVTAEAAPESAGVCAAGLHIALTPQAMQDVPYGYSTVLLLAYRQADVVARADCKLRVSHAYVADVVDLADTIRHRCAGADLGGAYLRGADLTDAYLGNADLRGAYLTGADLGDAHLRGADLRGADLGGAYLADADLADANLGGANLTDANLTDANLTGANLTGAYLAGANLTGAYRARTWRTRTWRTRT